MRPVNLIPPDERRGDAAPLRTGYLIYVLVAGMALLLLGIVAVTLTGKQINDREAKKANLQNELTQATAQAQSLQAFTSFRTVQENRASTVASLAQSRFDWQRVLHELALVLPSDVTVTNLTGTASPDVAPEDAEQINLRAEASGPALEIVGCAAPGQDAVAGFVAALQDIDGVTRVGLDSSKVSDPALGGTDSSSGSSGSSDSSGGSDDAAACDPHSSRPTVFRIVAAFDAVPTPPTATASPSVPPAAAPPATGTQAVASTQTPGG
jgi:Tfp pilus assembly protein PilN